MTHRVVVHTTVGGRRKNEDTNAILQNKRRNETYGAVFDGHGGGQVSKYLKVHMLEHLAKTVCRRGNSVRVFKDAFAHVAERVQSYLGGIKCNSGSTALVAYVTGTTLVVANCGDCRAVVVDDQGLAIPLTKDHKPGLYEERRRIEGLGGVVEDDPVINGHRILGMSVSRAFGDPGHQPFVVAEPDTCRTTTCRYAFVILATDGLWDVVSNQDAVEAVLHTGDGKNAARVLCDKAREKHTHDNVTAMVIYLH